MTLSDDPNGIAHSPQRRKRLIGRTVINDNQLEIVAGLRPHRLERILEHGPTVIGWDDDACGGHKIALNFR
jgi:hypothetical protein